MRVCSTARGLGLFPTRAQDGPTAAGGARATGSDLTVARDVQLHQLHEVGHLGGEPLDLIVAQAQLAQVQEPEERLRQESNGVSGSAVGNPSARPADAASPAPLLLRSSK